MILAFKLSNLITVPFGWLLAQLYYIFDNYGVAMILFGILVQLIMLPIKAKSKKSMMKMSRIQPMVQDIQRRYTDPQKQNEMLQKLYQEEGVNMGGGCLWSMVPLFILIPLFTVIREPITYILMESQEVSAQIIELIKEAAPQMFNLKNNYYDQVSAAQAIPMFAEELKAAIPAIKDTTLAGINFNFLGINLGAIPEFNIFSDNWAWDWAHIGAFLIPLMSAGSQVLTMWISQKANNSVVTNENGIQDEETAKKSQQNQSTQMMLWMMPLMSLWIGFTVSASLSLYWFVGGIIGMISDVIMTKHYRKIYDEEDAIRLQRHLEEERLEAEKERIRAERRAANPDGITSNTSKKKLQRQQREMEQAEKAAAAREYAAKKGVELEEESEASCMSGIPSRPYCKGRNYDPNRYA